MKHALINRNRKQIRISHKSKKKHGRVISALLIAVLVFSLAVPVFAAALNASTPKQEVVYIDLNSDGTVSSIYVVNIFELDEDGQIIDYGDYTALRNMTTNDEIVFENETVKIDTKAGKLYYEGTLDRNTIPWNFSIRYYLDGIEYPAEELAGKSGALKITMAVRQNPNCNSTFFENYSLQASFTLDTAICKNIVAEGATAANVGADRQLTYTILAKNEKDIMITADVSNFEMDGIAINGVPLNMDVEVDTDNNAELNEQITDLEDAVAELDDGANEIKDGAEEVRDGAGELKDGAAELQDGTNELYDGVVKIRAGARKLYDGSVDLDSGASDLLNGASEVRDGASDLTDGAAELTDRIKEAVEGALEIYTGAGELKDGANNLSSGASSLYSGLNTLAGQNATLLGGAYTVFQQLTAQAEQQLNASLTAAGISTVTLTPENYDTVISELLDLLSGGAYSQAAIVAESNIRSQVEDAVAAQIEAAIRGNSDAMVQIDVAVESAYGTEIDAAAQNYVALEYAKVTFSDNPEAWLHSPEGQAAVAAYLTSPEGQAAVASAREEIKAQYIDAAVSQQISEQMASSEVQAQIDAAIAEQLASDEVQAQIADAVNAALGENAAYQGILSLKNQLDNYNAFYLGLQQYTDGVSSAASGAASLANGASDLATGAGNLRAGTKTLYDGLVELRDGSLKLLSGSITLRDGTIKLYNGVLELKDGTTELLDGVVELKDGTITLYDGMVELKDGVIELLNGAIELHDGTIELYDGTVELTDGTFEFRDKTANLDKDLKDKINDAISDMLGGDFEIVSFVSDKNTNVESVQFVIKTDGIGVENTTAIEPVVEQPLTFWQKLLRLFGLY